MKTAIIFVLCLALSFMETTTHALELEDPQAVVTSVESLPYPYTYKPERADRHRRVTCDLLSVNTPIGSVNHAACAAHCLALGKGYRGGRCIDGVCNCRK